MAVSMQEGVFVMRDSIRSVLAGLGLSLGLSTGFQVLTATAAPPIAKNGAEG